MKTIKNITLSVLLLLSAGSAKAFADFDGSKAVQNVIEVKQSLKQTAEELLQADEVLADLAPKMVAANNFFNQYASLPFASLKKAHDYSMQIFNELDFGKLFAAAKRLGMTVEEAVKHYGNKAIELPEFAKNALKEQEIFSNKVTKIATVTTIAVAVGSYVAYKYDLPKKAYNGLVALKNKVFGKPVQK